MVRSLYRNLLREFPLGPPKTSILSRPSPLLRHLRQALSQPTTEPDGTSLELKRAEQLVCYLRAQRKHNSLIERYNPGMNMTTEERVRLSARRVGLDLPKVAP